MKVFLFFYIDWLFTQFDSALLTFLKNVLLISPVSGFFCLLSIWGIGYGNVFLRREKYRKPQVILAIISALAFTLLPASGFTDWP